MGSGVLSMTAVDELSRVIGRLEQQASSLATAVTTLGNAIHTNRDMQVQEHSENKKALNDLKTALDPLVNAVNAMQPIVKDYETNKNRAYGFVLALSGFWFTIGFLLQKIGDWLPWKMPTQH